VYATSLEKTVEIKEGKPLDRKVDLETIVPSGQCAIAVRPLAWPAGILHELIVAMDIVLFVALTFDLK